jgi:hypothetical protein
MMEPQKAVQAFEKKNLKTSLPLYRRRVLSIQSNQMPSISITQALAELKLLRRRMDSALDGVAFVALKKKRDTLDVASFNTEAAAAYQSYMDLLARYNGLKAAIVQSNAVTEVTVAGVAYTVAAAVERKRTIEFEKQLLAVLRQQYKDVQELFEAHQRAEQLRVERLLQVELGKDSRTSVETVSTLTETFLAQNKAEILDPLGLADKIRKLSTSIEEFETTIDWVLSESNGRTLITVP